MTAPDLADAALELAGRVLEEASASADLDEARRLAGVGLSLVNHATTALLAERITRSLEQRPALRAKGDST